MPDSVIEYNRTEKARTTSKAKGCGQGKLTIDGVVALAD